MMFKIFLIAFSLYAIFRAKKQYENKQASRYWLFLWSCMWLVVILAALFPQFIDVFAAYVGVGRGADLFMYVAVVFLVFATYRSMIRQQNMSEEITELVRKIAIDNPKKH